MRKEDRVTVARTIWDAFCKVSGQQRDMTCAEWYVLSGWMDRDIPLPVILTAFGEFKGKPRKLEAMQTPVERAYKYYRQAMGGL